MRAFVISYGRIHAIERSHGRRIKLQDLHILMTVVQAGSMGKAARQLNTSQPNISKSIADLEHALHVSSRPALEIRGLEGGGSPLPSW
jgi:DNA-binding MarR family transcriptional regulator